MNKADFFAQLGKKLSGLPNDDIKERLTFFSEMIEDRIEEGFTEEEAVSAIGSVDEIVDQTITDIPFTKIAKERIKPNKHLKFWEIILLALGSPIWLSLCISAVAIIFSIYISLWSVIISLWSVFAAFIGCSCYGIVAGLLFIFSNNFFTATAIFSLGFVCIGLSIFMFYGCKSATKGIIILTKKFLIWFKKCIIKRGNA